MYGFRLRCRRERDRIEPASALFKDPTNKTVKFKRGTILYGNITAGDKVEFNAVDIAGMPLGPTYLHYRPASHALTEPFWPMKAL